MKGSEDVRRGADGGRGDIYKWNFLANVHRTCKFDLHVALDSCAP